jgi:AraC-like DNA-binding protein
MNNPTRQLAAAKDSLLHLLKGRLTESARLQVLMNLGDVGLNLDNDYVYIEKLWQEALKAHDENAIITAGRSLTLRWLNSGDMTKADKWIKICEKQFFGKHRNPELSYLRLMRDIRLYLNQSKMASELVAKRLSIKENKDAYERMSDLYKLGTLALSEWSGNGTLKMKPWNEYMEEGYKVAKSLPFDESYSFRNQFLLALSQVSVDYNREYIRLLQQYRALPAIKARPYFSHRGDIMAYAQMFNWGKQLSRKEVDYWFKKFCELTTSYPFDCPTPYHFYFYAQAINYYLYIGDKGKVLQCCDSTIAHASQYQMDDLWFYEVRGETLADLGRWKDAYDNSKQWVAKKDSVAKVSSAAKLMELQTQYGVDKLTYEKKSSRMYLLFSVVICVLLAIGLWILYRHYRVLRRKNTSLYEVLQQLQQSEETANLAKERIPDDELSRDELLYRNLCKLMREEHPFTEQIGRKDLADRLGTNVTYIADAVRKYAEGMKVSEFINLYRLRYAGELLIERSELSVNAVGEEAGFSSRTTYYRLFNDYFGMSPNEYRTISRRKVIKK